MDQFKTCTELVGRKAALHKFADHFGWDWHGFLKPSMDQCKRSRTTATVYTRKEITDSTLGLLVLVAHLMSTGIKQANGKRRVRGMLVAFLEQIGSRLEFDQVCASGCVYRS